MIEKIGFATVGFVAGIVGTIVATKVIRGRNVRGGENVEVTDASPIGNLAEVVSKVVDVETW